MFEVVQGRKDFALKVMDNLVKDYKLSISSDITLLAASNFNDTLNVIFHSSKCADEATIEIAIKVFKAMLNGKDYDSASRLKTRIETSLGYFKGREGFTDSKIESLKEKIEGCGL